MGVLLTFTMANGLDATLPGPTGRAPVVPLRIHRGRFARTSGSCCVPTEDHSINRTCLDT